jgi:uncharacterized protein (TIGR02722 family)
MPHPTRLFLQLAVAVLVTGCAVTQQTAMVDQRTDRSAVGAGLDIRDFDSAAGAATTKMLAAPSMTKPNGGRYVVAVTPIVNETMQRLDTDLLTKKIRVAMLNSGHFVITTAVGLNGAEDAMSMQARDLRGSREFNQGTVVRAGQMVAPDLSLTGKIIQNNQMLGDGSQRVDYSFQLSITDIRTGLAYWEDDEPISKVTSNRTVTW